MTREEVIEELSARFQKLGAGPEIRQHLLDYNRTLLGLYDKFNTWAYSNESNVKTSFEIGAVRVDNGRAVAEVYLIGAGIEVKAALICLTDPNISS